MSTSEPQLVCSVPWEQLVPLASVPLLVDSLLKYYLEREVLSVLKAGLLAGDVASIDQRTTIVMQGRSGVGKTFLATGLVLDEDVRANFDAVVWLSVGARPDILELLKSAYIQIMNADLPEDSATSPELALQAIRAAARERSVLRVLDNCWDSAHEKLLAFSDNPASRTLVATRFADLLPSAYEVAIDALSEDEALQLLLTSAGMGGVETGKRAFEEGGREMRWRLRSWSFAARSH